MLSRRGEQRDSHLFPGRTVASKGGRSHLIRSDDVIFLNVILLFHIFRKVICFVSDDEQQQQKRMSHSHLNQWFPNMGVRDQSEDT